jgi:hypothetical protein
MPFDRSARFVGEAVLSGTVSSLTIGIACGATSAILLGVGPLVPYLAGSAVGYSLGLYQYWNSCKKYTLFCARQYPTLLAHALFVDFEIVVPASVQQHGTATTPEDSENSAHGRNPTIDSLNDRMTSMDQWIHVGGLGRLTWSILASQRCHPAVEAIQKHERQRLVDHVLGKI